MNPQVRREVKREAKTWSIVPRDFLTHPRSSDISRRGSYRLCTAVRIFNEN